MSDKDELDAWIEALAPVLQLPVAAEYRDGVKANLKLAREMAAILDGAELGDDAEPAPVFHA